MLSTTLKKLISLFPRYAEEGKLSSSVKKSLLQAQLVESGLSRESAILLLAVVERILRSVVTLDCQALQQGEWRFVSFPAQLLGCSLLQVLADDEQFLLESHFWESAQHENHLQAQYSLLHWLESQRIEFHCRQLAPPIRFIYVAWALIRLGDYFLLHRREDTRIRDGKGEYVLIGGRMNAQDLDGFGVDQLLCLQNPPPELLPKILENTLRREVKEETGLVFGEDYRVSHWRTLETYCDVAGAKANHAYTEYHLQIFSLSLTQQGAFRLWQEEQAHPEFFKRFSLDELVLGRTTDGKTAFLDALYADFSGDRGRLREALGSLTESFFSEYRFDDDFTLPLMVDHAIEKGVTAREKSLDFSLELNGLRPWWAIVFST